MKTGIGLGLIGSAFEARANGLHSWDFEEFHQTPERTAWRMLDAHDSGYVLPKWQPRSSALGRRITFDPAPDGREGFCHVVRSGDIVDPVGIDSARFPVKFSTLSRVLLRYHHWVEEHSYLDGKWIGLQLGRGWVGRGYAKDMDIAYGADGASATTMHPGRQGGNGIRLLATHTQQRSPFGELVGRGSTVLPRARWLTVDVVIDRNSGHRLYIDGQSVAESAYQFPVREWESCGAVWYRTRLMHGGKPELLPALNDYREWFGGFFVGVA